MSCLNNIFRSATIFEILFIGLIGCATFIVSSSQAAETNSQSLDSMIVEYMELNNIPGLAVAAVNSGKVIWTGTYGFGNVELETPINENTLFHIASVSKTITATVLLSLHAKNLFELDDDVNDYLPFRVRNPNAPEVPITFRHLLRHRSSIADNSEFYGPHWGEAHGDPTTSLNGYLRSYLSIDGDDYSVKNNFLQETPGDSRSYCNTCYALLGYLAEVISGKPFELLSSEILFNPLEMTNTGWFLRDLQGKEIAIPYRYEIDDNYVPYGHNGYPDWPAGQLRTSISDLAKFLAIYSNGGIGESGRLIDSRIIDVLSPQDAQLGFHTWFQRGLSNGEVIYQHGGGDIGVRTLMAFNRAENRGIVVLTNGESSLLSIAENIYLAIDSLLED